MRFLLDITSTCIKLAHRRFVHHEVTNLMCNIKTNTFRGFMRINRNIWLPIKHEAERVDFLAYGRQAKNTNTVRLSQANHVGKRVLPITPIAAQRQSRSFRRHLRHLLHREIAVRKTEMAFNPMK